MDELLEGFLDEIGEDLDQLDVQLVELETSSSDPSLIQSIFRVMHTLKGTAGMLGLNRLGLLTHHAEDLVDLYRSGAQVTSEGVTTILNTIDRVKKLVREVRELDGQEPEGNDLDLIEVIDDLTMITRRRLEADRPEPSVPPEKEESTPQPPQSDQEDLSPREAEADVDPESPTPRPRSDPPPQPLTVRTSVQHLNRLMDHVGELVLARNRIQQIARDPQMSDMADAVRNLSQIATELQEDAMRMRMQPIRGTFSSYTRTVRDLAQQLGKKIELVCEGEDTEVDRQVLDLIKDPLMHMIRNCADHALELPDERRAAGKPETGRIELRAFHEGGHIIIQISDDGRGIAASRVSAKALEKGMITPDQLADMTPNRIRSLVFQHGFSTNDVVTELSGRGVGMDVVRGEVESIGGTISLESEEGFGTTFSIKIPLTLAILSAFICQVGSNRFAIPKPAVQEIVSMRHTSDAYEIERVGTARLLRLRGALYPLIDFAEATSTEGGSKHTIMVCRVGSESFGLVVDDVLDVQEIVVKPLSRALSNTRIYSGNTILGDGAAIMIIDPGAVFATFGVPSNAADRSHERSGAPVDDIVKMIVFRAGSGGPKAVHLSVVSRVEKFPTSEIRQAPDGRSLVKYRDSLMPVVCPPGYEIDRDSDEQTIIVFTDDDKALGLAVETIERISSTRVVLDVVSDIDGIIGNAIIDGEATEIHDVSHYLDLGLGRWFKSRDTQALSQSISVLIVDDSQFFRNVLQSSIASRGYLVDTAEDAVEAISKMRSQRYDALVSDIEMPGMSGLEFISSIRSKGPQSSIPAIAISSHESREDRERGLEAGFNEYLAKTDRDAIFDFLSAVLDNKQEAKAQ